MRFIGVIAISFIVAILLVMNGYTISAQKSSPAKISRSVYFGKSKPLKEIRPAMNVQQDAVRMEMPNKFPSGLLPPITGYDSVFRLSMQSHHGYKGMVTPSLNFQGVGNVDNLAPADPNGDVGLNHVIQSVNVSFAVWDKEGNLLFGPVPNKGIWDVLPGPWHNVDWFQDPIFKYDRYADRWLVSAMVLDYEQELYYQMIAVSVSPDPLGAYHCYAFEYDNINDYPKIGIWHDGYYLTYWMNTPDWQYLHTIAAVVDKEAMLSGASFATLIEFEIEEPNPYTHRESAMAADLKGLTIPNNLPCYFLVAECLQVGYPWAVNLNVFELLTDWKNPENSTFGMVDQIEAEPVVPFSYDFPAATQPGNFHDLDAINFILMYPVTYRKFETHEMMTGCQTIWTGEKHCIRWFELRKENSSWYVYQTGHYSPDSASRYMPSISANLNGDIALGFTKSSQKINPSIWITGRRVSDTLGTMSYQEYEIYLGMNYANNLMGNWNRWGDYSCMMVDPEDDLSFWYTSMYTLEQPDYGNWATRIAKFKLDELVGTREFQVPVFRFQVYPNPTRGISDVRYQMPCPPSGGSGTRNVLIEIFDLQGRMVKTILREKQEARIYDIKIDVSDLRAGIYFVHLEVESKSYLEKLVLVK